MIWVEAFIQTGINEMDKVIPFVLTIFGASGDLAKLKIFPAVYELYKSSKLPQEFLIVGYARTTKTDEEFRLEFEQSIKARYGAVDINILSQLLTHVHYYGGLYNERDNFISYKHYLRPLSSNINVFLNYFSVPPTVFKDIIKNLGEIFNEFDTRVILEKPFGNDTGSARELFQFVNGYFHEDQIFLLDHYLGKYMVQQILRLRCNNEILNVLTQPQNIQNIQINVLEEIGVTNRIGYFDQVGMIKDLIQSHMLQLLALTTMSLLPDTSLKQLKDEKLKILQTLKFNLKDAEVNIGQYQSYLQEIGVPNESTTETFALVKINISSKDWENIPIYLRTGKKLNSKHTYIVIEYKTNEEQTSNNRLILYLQPEGKLEFQMIDNNNHINLKTNISDESSLSEHSTLLIDSINKEQRNFLSFKEIEACWEVTDAITNYIKENDIKLQIYPDNSIGPTINFKMFEI